MLMTTNATVIKDIRAYADFMSEGAARSLELLRRIDNTVMVMRIIASQGNGFREIIKDLTNDVSRAEGAIPEDELVA